MTNMHNNTRDFREKKQLRAMVFMQAFVGKVELTKHPLMSKQISLNSSSEDISYKQVKRSDQVRAKMANLLPKPSRETSTFSNHPHHFLHFPGKIPVFSLLSSVTLIYHFLVYLLPHLPSLNIIYLHLTLFTIGLTSFTPIYHHRTFAIIHQTTFTLISHHVTPFIALLTSSTLIYHHLTSSIIAYPHLPQSNK